MPQPPHSPDLPTRDENLELKTALLKKLKVIYIINFVSETVENCQKFQNQQNTIWLLHHDKLSAHKSLLVFSQIQHGNHAIATVFTGLAP